VRCLDGRPALVIEIVGADRVSPRLWVRCLLYVVLVFEARDVSENCRGAAAKDPPRERHRRDTQQTRRLAHVPCRPERHESQHGPLEFRERSDVSQDRIGGDAREAHPANAQLSRSIVEILADEPIELRRATAQRRDLDRRTEHVPDSVAVGQAYEYPHRSTRSTHGFRQRVEVRGQAMCTDADRAAYRSHERIHTAPEIRRRPCGAGAVAATGIADDERPFRSKEPTVQCIRDRHQIGFSPQGDGGAVRDRREQLLRHVVHEVPPRGVPAEDAAAEVAQLALVVDRDPRVEISAGIKSPRRQWMNCVGVSLSHRYDLIAKHRVRY
jgi:hypothetical protein